MPLASEIQERVVRVLDYHRQSKYTREGVDKLIPPDLANHPATHRVFESCPKVTLSTHLLDCPATTLEVMSLGLDALPESYVRPPQDLKTLSSWLFYAAGVTKTVQVGDKKVQLRSSPSAGRTYPCEIYVAAFGIKGLEPGLYHFSQWEFALRKLREGPETLWQLKRGRPDLEFLKTVPAAMLVSVNFWRSAWRFHKRAYRHALLDAGHQTENLSIAARGLGIQTVVRLRMTESSIRELIGIDPDADFATLEPVQSMVVWADKAESPLQLPKLSGGLPALPPIVRFPLSPKPLSYGSIVAVHDECTAPGVAIREIRSPVTELSPLPAGVHRQKFPDQEEMPDCHSLRKTLLERRSVLEFEHRSISRDQLSAISRAAFRGGSYFPVLPDGPHVGLIRSFWTIHEVAGMEPGLWYYHPPTDEWSLLRAGHIRAEARHLSLGQEITGDASAVCWMAANLAEVMKESGPDCYRVAHLESGTIGQRLALVATTLSLGSTGVASFYDDEVRQLFGIDRTGWEILYAVALGYPTASTVGLT